MTGVLRGPAAGNGRCRRSGRRGVAFGLGLLAGVGKVVANAECLPMVVPENALAFGESLLEQRDGLADPSCAQVGVGEAVLGSQGVGMGFRQDVWF
jgi:hypothetical protein